MRIIYCNTPVNNTNWIVSDKHSTSQGIASVNIKYAELYRAVITLHGLVSFDNCTFSGLVSMCVNRNQYEPEPTIALVKAFRSQTTQQKVTISRSLLKLRWDFNIYISDVVREIRIVQSDFKYRLLRLHIGKVTSNRFTLCNILSENDMLMSEINYGVQIISYQQTSFSVIHFSNTNFKNTWLINYPTKSLIRFHFDNCTFNDIDRFGVIILSATKVNIANCRFRLLDYAHCEPGDGCAVHIMGQTVAPIYPGIFKSLFAPPCTSKWYKCKTIQIENSVFVGSAGTSGGVISIEDMNLILINCEFLLTEESKFAIVAGFVYFKGSFHKMISRNVTFDASNLQGFTSVAINNLWRHSQRK